VPVLIFTYLSKKQEGRFCTDW